VPDEQDSRSAGAYSGTFGPPPDGRSRQEAAEPEHPTAPLAAILADRSSVDFRHPIIRSAVYDDIDPPHRSDTHLAAATPLHHADADLETVAAHLLRVNTAGDPWVVDRLAAAAARGLC
jgi:hypothetical protein